MGGKGGKRKQIYRERMRGKRGRIKGKGRKNKEDLDGIDGGVRERERIETGIERMKKKIYNK